MDLHHEPSPSHGEMQHSYTLGAQTNAERRAGNAEFSTAGPGRSFRAPRFAFSARDGSVAGLAPARLGLKARLLDRLCIHGQTVAAGVGLAPTPPVLQTGVQTLYTIQRKEMVVPAGNAPASPAYRAGALLLSYGTLAEGVGNAPTSARADPVFGTGAASLYLPAFHKWLPGLDSHQHRPA